MRKITFIFVLLIFLYTQFSFGEEIFVNQYTEETQWVSRVTMNQENIFTVVWQSQPTAEPPWAIGQDGDWAGVFARQFWLDGTPITDEFQVNTHWLNWQDNPDIASSGDGDFVVVWQSYEQVSPGSRYDVFGQRYTLDCTPVGEEFRINTITQDNQGYVPRVAMDSQGNFIVVWSSGDSPEWDVYARWYNSDGIPSGDEFLVNTYQQDTQMWPVVDMKDSGEFIIVWQSRYQDGDEHGIYAQRYDANCMPIGPEFQVNTYTTNKQLNPEVAIFPDGGFAIAWSSLEQDGDDWGIYARIYDSNGNPIGDEFLVHEHTENKQTSKSIAADSEGNLVITWCSFGQDGDQDGIFARKFTPTGEPICDEFQVNETWEWVQGLPSICMNDKGDFVVSWMSSHADTLYVPLHFHYDTFARTFPAIQLAARNHIFTPQTGDDDLRLEPGESGSLVIKIKNLGLEHLENVSATLETQDNDIMITEPNGFYEDIPIGATVSNDNAPFEISLSQDAEPHLAHLTLSLTADDSIISFPIEMYVGRPSLVLIDDDQHKDYETYFIEVLDSLEVQYEHWDSWLNEGELPTPLTEYDTVIWYTAESDSNTLTQSDMLELSEFMNNGGNLFINGQNIGADIGESIFYTNFLHSEFLLDGFDIGVAPFVALGKEGDPIGGGMNVALQGEGGENNQVSPDAIAALSGADTVFTYLMTDNYCAGIRWAGDYKVVYFPFSFESVKHKEQRVELIDRILSWFSGTVWVEDPPAIDSPYRFALNQNYPNPFNPETRISFQIPQTSKVSETFKVYLNIYDISGKLVKTLIDGEKEPGYHSVVWDGKDETGREVSSGVYFYRIDVAASGHAPLFTKTKKMLLLK